MTSNTTTTPRKNWTQVKLDCQAVFQDNPSYYRGDSIAKREYWLNYTDDLSRSGEITQKQRDQWSCPF